MPAKKRILSRITTIPLTEETRNKLRSIGSKGEIYDDIILRLIADYESKNIIDGKSIANFVKDMFGLKEGKHEKQKR